MFGKKNIAEILASRANVKIKLLWNGKKEDFIIHKINFMEILNCGKYPNVFLQFGQSLIGKKDEPEPVDVEKYKTEQKSFYMELARKSMVEPKHDDVYDLIKSRMPDYKEGDAVLPEDFYPDLYLMYISEFGNSIKKKYSELISKDSAGTRNTGEKRPPVTLA